MCFLRFHTLSTGILLALFLVQCEKEPAMDNPEENVFEGSIWIYSEEISEGLLEFYEEGYTVLTGNLTITNTQNVDLSLLRNIERIDGFVSVSDYNLSSLSFLQNLRHVGGSLEITAFLVRSLEPIKNIRYVGGRIRFSIQQTSSITSFDSLTYAGGLRLDGCANDHPFHFPGLRDLESLNIEYCNFKSLTGLEFVETIGELVIKKCDYLQDMTGLTSLDSVTNIAILYNEELTDFSGLINIRSVERFIISTNVSLESLYGLHRLKSLQYIGISENSRLVDFCDLPPRINHGNPIEYWSGDNGYNPTLEQLLQGECSLENDK